MKFEVEQTKILNFRQQRLRKFGTVVLLVAFLAGCGGSTAEKGEALAKKGVAISEEMTKFYIELSEANTMTKDAVLHRLGEVHGSPVSDDEEGEQQEKVGPESATISESYSEDDESAPEQYYRDQIEKNIELRKGVAAALKECASGLENLSKFDMKAAGAAAQGFTDSLNGLAGTFNLPQVPTKLFTWLQTEMLAAQRNRDIKRAAAAMRWAVYDLSVVFEVEMGEWAPMSLTWKDLLEKPNFDLSKVKYPHIPRVDFRSTGIVGLDSTALKVKTSELLRAVYKTTASQTPEDLEIEKFRKLARELNLPKTKTKDVADINKQPLSAFGYLLMNGALEAQNFHNKHFRRSSGATYSVKLFDEEILLTPDTRSDVWNAAFLVKAGQRFDKLAAQLRAMQKVHRGLLELVVEHDKLFGTPDPSRRPKPTLTPADEKILENSIAGKRLLQVWKGANQ